MKMTSSRIGPLAVIDQQRYSRFHCVHVDLPGADGIRLRFDNIHLPAGHGVELIDQQRRYIKRMTFDMQSEHEVIVPGSSVFIRVTLPSAQDSICSSLDLVRAQAQIDGPALRALIGKDERQPYVCFDGTTVGRHSLAAAMMSVGRTGSGSLIGKGNLVLTNWHVVRNQDALRQGRGEIWLNWVHERCDTQSPVKTPLMLEADQLLATGETAGSSDYTLFSLKDFDYTHSQVKRLFGGLRIRETDPALDEAVYVPQYGNGGLMPMHVSTVYEDEHGVERPAKVVGPVSPDWTKCNADTQSGSSGSPIISAATGEIVGLHGAALGRSNGGPSATRLHRGFGDLIAQDNEAVVGLGNVTVHNLELTTVLPAVFTIDLGAHGRITAFDTVTFEHHDDFTLAHVKGLDLGTEAVFDTTLRLQAKANQGFTHLADESLAGIVEIIATRATPYSAARHSRSWLALGVYQDDHYLSSTVVRLSCHEFDPFEVPFPVSEARTAHLHLDADKAITLAVEAGRFGFVAQYWGEGPGELQRQGDGYSVLRVPVREHADGEMTILSLRGYRQRDGQLIPMNVSGGGLGNDLVSTLRVEYHPEDNAGVELPARFEGVLPLMAMVSGQPGAVDVLVRVYAGMLAAPDITAPRSEEDAGMHPIVSGRAAPGAWVEVVRSFDPGARYGTTVADAQGRWALRVERELPEGVNRISVRQGLANRHSRWSANRAFRVVDALAVPVIDRPAAGDKSPAMVFSGRALPGSIVSLLDAATHAVLGQALADAEGAWFLYLARKCAEGPLAVQVLQELDGMVSARSVPLELTVITQAEPPLIVEPMPDALVTQRPVVRGRALAGSAVTVVQARNPGHILARATADENGDWQAPVLQALPVGPFAISARIAGGHWSMNRGFGVQGGET
ncbi:trypsin-like peptidase domain-containing protein [Pseudomonas sp. microsymbiont 2]